ncbi:hypothetical protein D3C76_1793560 [compost metagenome]
MHANQQVGGADFRHGYLTHLEHFRAAKGFKGDRFHGFNGSESTRVDWAMADAVIAAGNPA